jgi:hypothetical protein
VADLTDWLTTQIDTDETVARTAAAANGSQWSAVDGNDTVAAESGGYVATGPWAGGIGPSAEFIARWDPARVLAECVAKRAITALHTRNDRLGEIAYADRTTKPATTKYRRAAVCIECGNFDDAPVEWPCDTLRLPAAPYASNPGYQPEWAPQTAAK